VRTPFRLDAIKFRSGILNSYGAVPSRLSRVLAVRKPARSAIRANFRGKDAIVNGFLTVIFSHEIFNQKDNRTREPNNTARALERSELNRFFNTN
jgi:hypothetical protein